MLCGICYGFFMYYVAEDVVVPVLRGSATRPAWEALIGNVLFHGLVLSEYITIAHRRNLARPRLTRAAGRDRLGVALALCGRGC